jgi:hypothetical protein
MEVVAGQAVGPEAIAVRTVSAAAVPAQRTAVVHAGRGTLLVRPLHGMSSQRNDGSALTHFLCADTASCFIAIQPRQLAVHQDQVVVEEIIAHGGTLREKGSAYEPAPLGSVRVQRNTQHVHALCARSGMRRDACLRVPVIRNEYVAASEPKHGTALDDECVAVVADSVGDLAVEDLVIVDRAAEHGPACFEVQVRADYLRARDVAVEPP